MENKKSEKFYITTPIYYANGAPHIGHFLTTTIADTQARYNRKRLGDENVFFTTGLDCHGTTVEQSAYKAGFNKDNIQEFIDDKVEEWEKAFQATNISYDYFVNTTNPKHKEHAKSFIQKMINNGDVYKGTYKGKYCNGCEKFLTLSDLNEKGLCPLHREDQVVEISEDNYFFKLSKYAPKVLELIEERTIRIVPDNKRNEVLARLRGDIEDISISRPKEKVSWGIEFPDDPNQTVYVWVEALINYTSSLEIKNKVGFWEYTTHTLAKDINWFHNIIWPAMLLSAGQKLYKGAYVHGFLTVGGQKISKSLGNVITPGDLIQRYGVDGARYVILSNFPYKDDADVTWEHLDEKYNADLANGIGNTFARLTKLAQNSILKFDIKPIEKTIWEAEWANPFAEYRLDLVIQNIFRKLSDLDKHINENSPWEIKDKDKLQEVLNTELNALYEIATILEPFIPSSANCIRETLEKEQILGGIKLFPRI